MRDRKGMTDSQIRFLRLCIAHPRGVPAEHCPSPVVYRRWMRRTSFRRAMQSLRNALRSQTELQLAAASYGAAIGLNRTINSAEPDVARPTSQKEQIQSYAALVRVALSCQRLNHKYEKPEPEVNRVKETERQIILRYLRWQHPRQPAIALIADLDRPDLVEKEKRELEAQKQKRPAA